MPKKTKKISASHTAKTNQDFFFFVVVTVFAALTLFGAGYLNAARQKAIQASQNPAVLDLAPLNIATPAPKPSPSPGSKASPSPSPKPVRNRYIPE